MSNTPAPQLPDPAAFTAPAPAPAQLPLKICIQPTTGEVITSLRTGVSAWSGNTKVLACWQVQLGRGKAGQLIQQQGEDRNGHRLACLGRLHRDEPPRQVHVIPLE